MSPDEWPDTMTLGEARDKLRDLVDEGHRCPTCAQFAKVYRRKIHATMARDLIACYRSVGAGASFHLPTVLSHHHPGDFAKLRYWGLLVEEDERREDGGRAGYWRITALGERWLCGRAAIPSYARIYDGRLLGLAGEPLSIRDALGDKFNYAELMADASPPPPATADPAPALF